MKIEEALVTYLLAQTGLVSKVSSRIYAMHAPANVKFPIITCRRISTERLLTHDQTHNGLSTPRIQFDVMAKTYQSALDVLEQLRISLQGYRGTMGGTGGVYVGAVLPALEQHDDDPDNDYYRLTIDYMISHEE